MKFQIVFIDEKGADIYVSCKVVGSYLFNVALERAWIDYYVAGHRLSDVKEVRMVVL